MTNKTMCLIKQFKTGCSMCLGVELVHGNRAAVAIWGTLAVVLLVIVCFENRLVTLEKP